MADLSLGTATIEADFGYGTLDVAVDDLVDLVAKAPAEFACAAWRDIPISLGACPARMIRSR